MKTISQRLKQTAYHEAGHLVADIIFKLKPFEASIVPEKEKSAGHVRALTFGDYAPYIIDFDDKEEQINRLNENKKKYIASRFDDHDKVRRIARKMIISCYAGHEASKKIKPNVDIGYSYRDNEIAIDIMDLANITCEYNPNEDWYEYDIDGKLWNAAVNFVDKHWGQIERVAKLLLEKKTLYKDDIMKLSREILRETKEQRTPNL
ncbi:MAG: hypothetical protein M0Q38_15450 [Bacteroidales bacterium]|jgi:hypothetical protein|nr:hypothetical protein [Bacteroidales bacterium]